MNFEIWNSRSSIIMSRRILNPSSRYLLQSQEADPYRSAQATRCLQRFAPFSSSSRLRDHDPKPTQGRQPLTPASPPSKKLWAREAEKLYKLDGEWAKMKHDAEKHYHIHTPGKVVASLAVDADLMEEIIKSAKIWKIATLIVEARAAKEEGNVELHNMLEDMRSVAPRFQGLDKMQLIEKPIGLNIVEDSDRCLEPGGTLYRLRGNSEEVNEFNQENDSFWRNIFSEVTGYLIIFGAWSLWSWLHPAPSPRLDHQEEYTPKSVSSEDAVEGVEEGESFMWEDNGADETT